MYLNKCLSGISQIFEPLLKKILLFDLYLEVFSQVILPGKKWARLKSLTIEETSYIITFDCN
jgi:hypothetical protein